jgi:hypothetical protein
MLLPKSIIRLIFQYIHIDTFCESPIQILQLMTIGIGPKNIEYKKKIFDDYCSRIVDNSHLHTSLTPELLDTETYQDIYDAAISNFPDNESLIELRWLSSRGTFVLMEEEGLYFHEEEISIDHIVKSAFMPCLRPFNDTNKSECMRCESTLIDGQCKNLSKIVYKHIMTSIPASKSSLETRIRFFDYIKSLRRIKDYNDMSKYQRHQLFE